MRYKNRVAAARSKFSLKRAAPAVVRDDSGVAMIEFALLVPLLVILVLATSDIGLAVYRKMQVENAAEAGAQYAVQHGFDTGAISSSVSSASSQSVILANPPPIQFCGCASASGISVSACETPCPGGGAPGSYVTVSAQSSYDTTINYPLVASSIAFTSQSTVRIK